MALLSTLRYLLALARLNIGAGLARPWLAVTAAAMMFGNNLIMSVVWLLYFSDFSNLRGWRLEDLGLLMGIVAWAFGLTVFVLAGVRDLAQTIVDGALDPHLGRPRHPLPGLLMSRSAPSGLGDMASAFIFWLWMAGRSPGDLPLLLLVATAAAIVLAATVTAMQCVVFWVPGAVALSEELFNTFLMVTFYPQHPFSFAVRLALFTVFPTAFVALLPVLAIRDPDPMKVLGLLAAAAVYAGIALLIFERGLRRYASGNRVIELR